MYYLVIPRDASPLFSSAGRFISKEGHIHPRRTLDSAVLLVGYSGICPITSGGRSYNLSKGDAMLLFPEEEHYGSGGTSENQSHFWCHFYLPNGCFISEEPVRDEGFIVIPEFSSLCELEKFCVLFPQMIDAAETSVEGEGLRSEICSAYLKILLCELSENRVRDRSSPAVAATRAREWIRLYAKNGITPKSTAEALGYNADYLSALLRRHFGKTLGGLITESRLKEAERLLLNTDMKVSEIAYACGFGDEKYFMRIFSRHKGMSAGQFRRTHFREHRN